MGSAPSPALFINTGKEVTMMEHSQRAKLERRKFFADPLMVGVILILVIFLSLFILYPLAMLMTDSVYSPTSYSVYQVAESQAEIEALLAAGGKEVRKLSVDRKAVLQVPDIEGLTLTKEMGKTASTTYMADMLDAEMAGSTVAVPAKAGLLSLQSFPHIFTS